MTSIYFLQDQLVIISDLFISLLYISFITYHRISWQSFIGKNSSSFTTN